MSRERQNTDEFEEISSYSSSKEYRKHRQGSRWKKILMAVAAVLCVLLIAVGAGMIYVSTVYLSDLTTTDVTKDPETLGIAPEAVSRHSDDSITNIALFGLDARGDVFVGQSDVVMILTVDNKHHKVKMTSLMRDSRVSIEGTGFDGYYDTHGKLNAAYSWGGPELAMRTVNRNFGMNIQNYVTINFAKMATIIDAFGGVDLEITGGEMREINVNLRNLRDEIESGWYTDEDEETAHILDSDFLLNAWGEVDFYDNTYEGGVYHLNGNQAVAYGRIRNIGDDFERVQRQQKVFYKLMEKVANISVTEYPGIIREMMPLCETNLTLQEVLGLAPIVMSGFTVESISVPNADYELDLHDVDYDLVYDLQQASHRVDAFIYEDDSDYWDEYGYDTGASQAQ